MGPYVDATWGWDEAEQLAYFDAHFDPTTREVIQAEGTDIGVLEVEERADEIHLATIALLPDWQGRGIGTSIVRALAERARGSGRAVTLQVLHANPRAAKLYTSLGFVTTGGNETHAFMRLEKSPSGREGVWFLSQVTEPEVIASFLRAELESDRWSGVLSALLEADQRSASVVTSPDLGDPDENAYRDGLLDRHRAWLQRAGLFGGFPEDVEWFRAALSPERVLSVLYIDWDWWLRISGGTRLPLEAARRIRNGDIPGSTAEWHEPIAARLRRKDPPPELIIVSLPDLSKLVLLEGHVRLTAYALFPKFLPESLEVYLGISEEIQRWSLW